MNVAECKNGEKYCHKSIGIGIGNTFQNSIGNIGISSTYCQSIVTGVDNTFHKSR